MLVAQALRAGLALAFVVIGVQVLIAPTIDHGRQNVWVALGIALLLTASGVFWLRNSSWLGSVWGRFSTGARRIFLWAIFVLSIVVQTLWQSRLLQTEYSWDAEEILKHVVESVSQGWPSYGQESYLIAYPNNAGLALVESLAARMTAEPWFSGHDAAVTAVFALNVISSGIAVFFAYLSAKRLASTRRALGAATAVYVLVSLSPVVAVPYTDGLAVGMPVLALYLVLRGWQAVTSRGRLLWLFSGGMVVGIGSEFKPTVAIIGIATCVVLLLSAVATWKRRTERNTSIAGAALIVIAMAICGLGSSTAEDHFLMPLTPRISHGEHPIEYWLATGLTGDGTFDWEFNEQMWDATSTAEKRELAIEHLKEKLEESGVSGELRLIDRKLVWEFSDASFDAFGWTQFYGKEQFRIDDTLAIAVRSLVHPDGAASPVWYTFLQVGWLLVLGSIVMWLGVALRKRVEPSGFELTLLLSTGGVIAYLSLFEAHPRYVFIYLPVFILLAATGGRNDQRSLSHRAQNTSHTALSVGSAGNPSEIE